MPMMKIFFDWSCAGSYCTRDPKKNYPFGTINNNNEQTTDPDIF